MLLLIQQNGNTATNRIKHKLFNQTIMKKTLFSALALIALVTACNSTDVVAPRPTTTTSPAMAPTANPDTIPAKTGYQDPQPTIIRQDGELDEVQPVGQTGAVDDFSAVTSPGSPVRAVMPADTLASVD